MMRFGFGSRVYSIGFAVALLAGCGVQATTRAVPQGVMPMQRAHGASGSSGDLLYVSDLVTNDVYAFNYPNGGLVFKLKGLNQPWSLCSDGNGNVFVDSYGNSDVVEYAHGARHPIQTLNLPGNAISCSVDSTTGNLAVVFDSYSKGSGVAVFPNEQGPPTFYYPGNFDIVSFCGYDNAGDLFLDGATQEQRYAFFVLPKGGNGIHLVPVSGGEFYDLNQIQWDGEYMAVEDSAFSTISRIQFRGYGYFWSGTFVGVTNLTGCNYQPLQSWIDGGAIIVPCYDQNKGFGHVKVWNYPAGGKFLRKIARASGPFPNGVTVSVAQPGSRIHE